MKGIIIFGAPGSGKGTQAKLLQDNFNYVHISTGDLLRKEIFDQTELGKKIEKILSEGHFASDEDMETIIDNFLKRNKKNFILDGYPRTLEQAKSFLKKINFDLKVIHLVVHEEELKKRLLLRGKIQNRPDDNEKIILERFRVYEEKTKPILDFYRKNKIKVIDIEGVGKIDEIHKKIVGIL